MWEYLNTKKFDARLLPIAGYLANKLKGKVVLDLDCGYARLADYLPIGDYQYIGNDIDNEAIFNCCLRHCGPNYLFVGMSDSQIAREWFKAIDILICTGYATGFSEAESNTLDDSIKELINRYSPSIVIFEASTLPLINRRLVFLCDWVLSRGYSEEFDFKVDVMEEPDMWQLRNAIILERIMGGNEAEQ